MIRHEDFLEELFVAVPESRDMVAEHLADNDGLLLHVLMSDLLQMTVRTYAAGEVAVTDRLLAFIDRGLREGDERVVKPSPCHSSRTSVSTPESRMHSWDAGLGPSERKWDVRPSDRSRRLHVSVGARAESVLFSTA